MKILILLLALLVCVQSGEYQSQCQSHPACSACSIEWNCEYGQNEEKTEECYQHCLVNAIDYNEHGKVLEGEEVKVHLVEVKKANNLAPKLFLQTKQKGPQEVECLKDPMCAECATSYMCSYGNDPYEQDQCFKDCSTNKNDYGYDHSLSQKQKGVQVHAQIKSKQEKDLWKKKCLANAACEACSLSWQCDYGQNQELVDECYKMCDEHYIDYDQHSSVRAVEEVKVHQ